MSEFITSENAMLRAEIRSLEEAQLVAMREASELVVRACKAEARVGELVAEVDQLRAVLAEPDEMDPAWLAKDFPHSEARGLHPDDVHAVVADLRQRAGVTSAN